MSVLKEGTVVNKKNIEAIINIVDAIRLEKDYAKAAVHLQDSGLSLHQLSQMTLRLSIFDIAKIGDELVKI